jgi:hypothetical protein
MTDSRAQACESAISGGGVTELKRERTRNGICAYQMYAKE